jgi:hypothetical protein
MNELIAKLSQTYFVKVIDNNNFVLIARDENELRAIAIKYNLIIVKMHTSIQDALR